MEKISIVEKLFFLWFVLHLY